MNAERLHAIASALKDEMERADIPGKMEELAQSLRLAVEEPNDTAHQQRVSSLRAELGTVLAAAPSNGFSPAWREALVELGVADLVGDQLRETIESIFDRNEITPASAADDLAPIAERLRAFDTALNQTLAGFAFFRIGAEELDPGEFEIGFVIPRDRVSDGLEELGKEFIKLTRILGPLQEISTGPRDELKLRSISSSAFAAFLIAAPPLALTLAKTMESLINSYEKVRGIRSAHETLKESGANETLLAEVANEAADRMSRDIKGFAKTLLAEAQKQPDKDRANELQKELEVSLNALANRIDRGYTVEVRAGELPAQDDDGDGEEPTSEEKRVRTIVEQVLETQEKLNFANDTGETILQLPEPKDSGKAADQTKPAGSKSPKSDEGPPNPF